MPLNVGLIKSDTTTKGDERYTPDYAVEFLIDLLPPPTPQQDSSKYTIWCPFDDEYSSYVRIFRKYGYQVIATGGEDFFEIEPDNYDIIISNPPFSKKTEVLQRLFVLNKPFMVLMPLATLQSVARYRLFAKK